MTRLNLMLHCGAKRVDRFDVVNAQVPAATRTWFPVPHTAILDRVENALGQSGYEIIQQEHAMTKDHDRWFGLMQVARSDDPDKECCTVIGARNSHDKTFPATVVLGRGVFICDNLSISGEARLNRKHTRHILRDLDGVVARAIGSLSEIRAADKKRFEAYRTIGLGPVQAHDMVVRCMDAQVIPCAKIKPTLAEYRNPRHPEFAEDGYTTWRFFNAVTETIKGNLDLLPKRSLALHGLLDAHCGLLN